ncbi:hypothetical protein [Cohnella fermenti]|uniref:Uncharacterized protein n=1 Tax=Cohnella fermenti TaxID=2565925 RepID=A0A4S4BHF9_9BACL|nr:hypothetical protein [Cohnella fermenti]THF72899.1 hypothetical protein E6C55_31350 [Cohnella fermenti]
MNGRTGEAIETVETGVGRTWHPIRDWLYAGPFDKDVSALYHDNYKVPVEPYLPLIEEAASLLPSLSPREGEELSLFGQASRWSLLRTDPSEHKMTWARFGVQARMLATFAYTRIAAPADGLYRFRLWLGGSSRIFLGGAEVFSHLRVGRVESEFELLLPLKAGENDLVLLLVNVHLHCMNTFTLAAEEGRLSAAPPLRLGGEARERLERDLSRFYLAKHAISGQETLELHWDSPPESEGAFVIEICRSARGARGPTVFRSEHRLGGSAGPLALLTADRLPEAGEYIAAIDYAAEGGATIGGIALRFTRIDWFAGLPQDADFARRKRYMLERLAEEPGNPRTVLYAELAKMELGEWAAVKEASIASALDYIDARCDCADFAMHGLLRMYARFADSGRLDEELLRRMKATILGFKYAADEPGRSMMFSRTENHEILFCSAEYVAGLLCPGEVFANSGQNGLFHALKGRLLAERWIKQKGTYGFMEWHSNAYYEEDMLALLSIVDFGEEYGLTRILARQLLDLVCAMLASHASKGVMGTTHGRSYEDTIIHPELEAMSCLNWLLFGRQTRLVRKLSIGCAALASSSYVPDPEWETLAADEGEWFTRTRMGLFPSEGMDGVNCATYRTRDYMVSGMVESKTGEPGAQVHVGQVLLDGEVPIFVTCFDNKSEMTRPSYWGGQYRNPKSFAHRGVLAYIYRLEEGPGRTHAYFPFRQFDETRHSGDWLFGRKRDAYVAVFSQKPYAETDTGTYKERELLCLEPSNIWLLEAGSKEQWGGFERFVEAVAAASLSCSAEGSFVYDSPSIGLVEMAYERPCRVGGKELLGDGGYPLIDNPHAYGEYGSGLVRLRFPNRTKLLNFRI